MNNKLVFKDVWRKNDAKAEQDAIAAWQGAGAIPAGQNPMARAKDLCAVAYDNGKLAAVSTVQVQAMPIVREKMAMMRAFVLPDYRQQNPIPAMTSTIFEAMRGYAVAHQGERVAGVVGLMPRGVYVEKPVTEAGFTFTGFTPKNDRIFLRWFDHYRFANAGSGPAALSDEAAPGNVAKVTHKDVWFKNDAKVEQDAIAAWKAADALPPRQDPMLRAKEICVAAYEGKNLVAVSTATIEPMPMVRRKMVFFRLFVVPEHRHREIVIPLGLAVHQAAEKYALAHPELELGGTAAIVSVKGVMNKPITRAHLILASYSRKNEPIILRWFDHFKFPKPQPAAQAAQAT
ncbi:MAG: hypothetical protein HY243_00555 [Proteobacteria bacterium]|nr:hypothetical protein [Pseudomonadota bacterium]